MKSLAKLVAVVLLAAAAFVVTMEAAHASGPIPVCYPGTPRCGF